MKHIPWRIGGPLALVLSLLPARAQEGMGPYRLVKEIPIGGASSWDYLSIDPKMHRLYVSHGDSVAVVDTTNDTLIGRIVNTPGVHGIAVAPELARVFISDGRENTVSVVDPQTFATMSKLDAGENPDAIIFEPGQTEVYAFNGRSHSATVIAADVGGVVATIPLPGKPEFAACDPAAGRVYDNIEDKNEVAVIDTKSHRVTALWPIAPGQSASGMAIDLDNHRLFVGCHNRLLVMMDSRNGAVVATAPIGAGVDAVAYDPAWDMIFTSNGEGDVTIMHEDTPSRLTVLQTVQTRPGARTMALDRQTHKIYLSSAEFAAAADPSHPGRPQALPGTFEVLVYASAPL